MLSLEVFCNCFDDLALQQPNFFKQTMTTIIKISRQMTATTTMMIMIGNSSSGSEGVMSAEK